MAMKERDRTSRFIIGQACKDIWLGCLGGDLTTSAAAGGTGSLTSTQRCSAPVCTAVFGGTSSKHAMLDNMGTRSTSSITRFGKGEV